MFKWFRKDTDVKSLEKSLEVLASKINKHEALLSKLRANSRRFKGAVTLYGILFYAIYLAIWALFLARKYTDRRKWIFETLPVLIGPFLLYIIRNAISSYYERRIFNEEATLDTLRSQQKEKIEDFKNKTGFYTTKNLIERYSTSENTSSPRVASGSAANSPAVSKQSTPNSTQQRQVKQQVPQQAMSSTRLQSQSQITPQRPIPQSLLGTVPTPASLSGTPTRAMQQEPQRTAEFAPNADALPTEHRDRHWYDRMLDVIVGEDEGSDHSRYKLEKKVREREERIAGLELELLKLKKMLDQQQPDTHKDDDQIMHDSKSVKEIDSGGSTGIAGTGDTVKTRKSTRRSKKEDKSSSEEEE